VHQVHSSLVLRHKEKGQKNVLHLAGNSRRKGMGELREMTQKKLSHFLHLFLSKFSQQES
jgi:hypothetical protein